MSGIFGIIDFGDGHIEPPTLSHMEIAMANWGPDGGNTWQEGPAALGHRLLYNTPEALYEYWPRWDPETGIAFTVEARIDNRDELCDLLQIEHPQRSTTPDGELIYRAYLQWGEDCPNRLLGDWSFAAWHPRERKFFLARDHHGNTALTYWQEGSRFAFASDANALYAIGAPRKLNELYFAQLLIAWSAYQGPQTIYHDIYRLPPAHALKATPEGVHMWQYWRLEDTPELHLPSFEQYVEGFLEVYDEAVRCRLRSHRPIGSTLSGGLDSGSVTTLAARALAEEGKELTAFTSVPRYETAELISQRRFGDETQFATSTARHWENINHVLLQSNEISPLQGVHRMLQVKNEPAHAASNTYWLIDLMQQAKEQELGTLLTGQGGNATISWTGAPELRSLLASIRREGWRQSIRRRFPIWLQRIIVERRLRRKGLEHTAIHPDFAQRMDIIARRIAILGRDPTQPESWHHPRDRRMAIIQPGRSRVGDLWSTHAAHAGLEVRDPTLDIRVMAYTLSIPDSIYKPGHNAGDEMDRRIIRAAMQGLMPDDVRLNKKRGLQAADLVYRLRNSAEEIDVALDEIDRHPTNTYLNLANMRRVWATIQNQTSPQSTYHSVTVLLRGIMAGLFLNSLENSREEEPA